MRAALLLVSAFVAPASGETYVDYEGDDECTDAGYVMIDSLTQCEAGAVICLQEVSQSWAGPLHVYFAERGYSLIADLYGKPFNNYMGVAVAYPGLVDAHVVYASVSSDFVDNLRQFTEPNRPDGAAAFYDRYRAAHERCCNRTPAWARAG